MPQTYPMKFAPQSETTGQLPTGSGNDNGNILVVMCQTCWCLIPQAVEAEHMQEVHQIGEGYVPEGPPTSTPA